MFPAFELIYQGILLGLITALSLGPVFFSIVEVSIRRGRLFGISIALGVLLSDGVIISVSFFSLDSLIHSDAVRNAIGVAGGLLLCAYGGYQLLKKSVRPAARDVKAAHPGYFLYIAKGFAINTLNPFVFIYWLSAVSIMTLDHALTSWNAAWFFLVAICSNFAVDVAKSFLAFRVKPLLTERAMSLLSRIVGIAVIAFGLRLLYKSFFM